MTSLVRVRRRRRPVRLGGPGAALVVTGLLVGLLGLLPTQASAAPPSAAPPTTTTAPTTTTQTTTAAPTTTPIRPVPRPVSVTPAEQSVVAGRTATFRASPAGPGDLRWQTAAARGGPWTSAGAGPVLTLTATPARDGHLFRAVRSLGGASATSAPVALEVVTPAAPSSAAPTTVSTPAPTPATAPTPTTAPATTTGLAPTAVPAPGATPTTGPDPTAAPPPATKGVVPAEPYGTLTDPTLALGLEQTAVGHGFPPGARVRVTLEPAGRDLGTQVAAADGTLTTPFSTVGLVTGAYTVVWTPVAD